MERKHVLYMVLAVLALPSFLNASSFAYQPATSGQNYGYAIFNGSAYVNTQAGSMPKGAAARAVFAWVYPQESPGTIYSYGLLNNNELSGFYINSNGILSFQGISNGAVSSFRPKSDSWNFVGYSYNANSTEVTFYYDGNSQTVSLSANEPLQTSGYAQSSIGKEANCNGPCSNFIGFISDLRVYTVAFNSSNADALYIGGPEIGRNGFTSNLAAWWQMNGSVLDYSGNGNSGSYHYISYGSFNRSKTFGVSSGTGGSVSLSPAGGVYNYGSDVKISATAIPGYSFANWSCIGKGCYAGNVQNATVAVSDNITETANFYKSIYRLSLAASPQNGGRIAIAANASLYSIKGEETNEPYAAVVNFSAYPDAGYLFVNWSCSGKGCYSGKSSSPEITIYNNITETANFAKEAVNISVSSHPSLGGTVEGGGIYIAGQIARITAAAGKGYVFANWSCAGSGCYSGKKENFTISAYANITETANFAVENSITENNTSQEKNSYKELYYAAGAVVIILAFAAAYRELALRRKGKGAGKRENEKTPEDMKAKNEK